MKNKYIIGEPRVDFYNFLGHHFVYADRFNIRIYECDKCKTEAFIKIENSVLEENISFKKSDVWSVLNISCDEMQIKNLLE